MDLQVSPGEIMSREVELGCESFSLQVVQVVRHSSAMDIVTLPKHSS